MAAIEFCSGLITTKKKKITKMENEIEKHCCWPRKSARMNEVFLGSEWLLCACGADMLCWGTHLRGSLLRVLASYQKIPRSGFSSETDPWDRSSWIISNITGTRKLTEEKLMREAISVTLFDNISLVVSNEDLRNFPEDLVFSFAWCPMKMPSSERM